MQDNRNDIKNIITEYSRKFADIVNDYDRVNALSTIKQTINVFNKILKEKPTTFDEELLIFIEKMCADVLRLPELSENIGLFSSNIGGIDRDKDRSGKGGESNKGEGSNDNNKVDRNNVIEFIRKDMLTIKGDTQVGKEKFTVMTAILHIFKGIIPVIITRNITGDSNKLERGINSYFALLENHMKENNKDLPFELKCIKSSKLSKDLKTIPLVICLGNATQLKHVYDFIKETKKRVLLLIDEIDHVDYGDCETSKMIADINSISYQKIGISATVMDVVFCESSLKSKNILVLSKPDDYRGLVDILVKILEVDPNTRGINNKVNTYKEILESDLNFELFLDYFSKTEPEYAFILNKCIPNICLIKNTRVNSNQDLIFGGIIKKYSKNIVTIVYNGNGIKMYYYGMIKIKINNKNIIPKEYADIDITSALQYLKDNGGVEKFPRIVIISGDYASRCTSFVTEDYVWHLTDMYYNPAASTPISEQIQNVGRLTGRNKGKSHLHLHCTNKVANALFYGYHFCNEIIDRAKEKPLLDDGNEVQFSESVKSIQMNKKKFPVGRKLCTKAEINRGDFNLVNNDDGGKNIEEYKYKIDVIELNEQKTKLKKTETKVDGEIDGVKIQNLKRWMRDDCSLLISRMLKFLYKENKQITFEDFKQGIDYRGSDKQFKNNVQNGRGVKVQYGFVWSCKREEIILNKNIRDYLNNL